MRFNHEPSISIPKPEGLRKESEWHGIDFGKLPVFQLQYVGFIGRISLPPYGYMHYHPMTLDAAIKII